MKPKRNLLRNQEGFTLIEIIAVLVILGILAAVAVPQYIDLQTDAKASAAEGQVAEMKGTINLAYSRYMLQNNGTVPTAGQIVTALGFTSGTAQNVGTSPDVYSVELTATDDDTITVEVHNRDGDTEYDADGTWKRPT